MKILASRSHTPRWCLRFSKVNSSLRGSIIAVNQTRSQVEEIFRNKKHHLQTTSYKVYILVRDWLGYKYSDSWIKQKHVRLEANRNQNGGARRDSYRNSKERME